MVSSSIPAPAGKPPLSYADRAKKAQNIKSPNSVPPPHPLPPSTLPPSGSSTSTTSNSTTLSNSSSSKPSSNSTSVDVTPSSSFTRSPSPSPTADGSDIKPVNGDSRASNDVTPPSLSIEPSQKKPPAPNVWSRRKEQMAAQAQAQPSRPPSQLPPLPSTQSIPQVSKSPVATRNPTTSRQPPPRPTPDKVPNNPHRVTAVKSNNASTSPAELTGEDPFVVRLPAQNVRAPRLPLPIPPVDDVDSWPEVGKSLPPATANNASAADLLPAPKDGGESKGYEIAQLATTTSNKKNEKTKWVPIPPEELQAASDAVIQTSNRHPRSRNQSQRSHSAVKPTRKNPSGSGSGSVQGQSRNNSGRNSTAQSVSQSRVHSRAGSLHSSPLLPRGKRLPGDDSPTTGTSGYGDVSGVAVDNSPTTGSPQPQPYVDAGLSGSVTYPDLIHGAGPVQLRNGLTSYYPQQRSLPPIIPQNQNQQHPQQSHPTPHSPMHTPYALPGPGPSPNGYHPSGSPALPPLPPQGYAGGPSPYQLYPPYGHYEYGHGPNQPYVYWNDVSGSGQHSPPYPPPQVSHLPQHQQQQGDIEGSQGEIPPLTMVSKPPPPDESQAASGYRVVGPTSNGTASKATERPVVFGSIGIPGASKCPSPALLSSSGSDDRAGEASISEKAFTMFSIGVAPGEGGPARLRSRTRSSPARRRTEIVADNGKLVSDVTNSEVAGETKNKEPGKEDGHAAIVTSGDLKVIDLTDTETKWQFGTTGYPEVDEGPVPPSDPEQQPLSTVTSSQSAYGHQLPQASTIPRPDSPIPPVENLVPLSMPLTSPMELQISSPQISAPFPIEGLTPNPLSPEVGVQGGGDEWEVKDFGYGFGPASGTGSAPAITREWRLAREKEREREKAERGRMEREMDRERVRGLERERVRERDIERERARDMEISTRPRRGSYGGGYNGYERGGPGGRRGRGGSGGYSGRGFNRNFNRGAYQGSQQQQQPPFSITPPPHFQPLVPLGEHANGYYPPPQPHLAPYVPPVYEPYAPPPPPPAPVPMPPQLTPPVPVPLSTLSFPLDPTRWYLLGQLEYYLSPQNMAQDFFLRQQMDSRGWIPISLIASFKRVTQLTMDVQLVKNVLDLSKMVWVKDEWVRMNGWEQFVLPDAPKSNVEGYEQENVEGSMERHEEEKAIVNIVKEGEVEECEGEGEGEAEEEEEEDVVFVMGREAGSWSPERHT